MASDRANLVRNVEGFVVLFSLPRLYEDHQDKVDEYLSMARTQISSLVEQAKSKLPAKLQKQKSS